MSFALREDFNVNNVYRASVKNGDVFYVNNIYDLTTFFTTKYDKENKSVLNLDLTEIFDNNEKIKNFLNEVLKYKEKFNKQIYSIQLSVPYEKIEKSKIKILENFNNNIKDKNLLLTIGVVHRLMTRYNDFIELKCWRFDSIAKANNEIDKVCEYIKKCDFSPAEALAFIHNYVSTIRDYKDSDDKEYKWYSDDQFFVNAYQKDRDFVCAGFSSLEKEIIDTLNLQGLKCENVAVDMNYYNKENKYIEGSHERNLIIIKDDKYGINKTCFDDPTWDNDEDGKELYTHFMLCNDCHDDSNNNKYEYRNLDKFVRTTKTEFYYSHLGDYELYNKGRKVNQKLIETIYFSMFQKSHPDWTVEQIAEKLKVMAENSFNEQKDRKYDGYLKRKELSLKEKEMKAIYNANLKNNENIFEF